MIEQYCCYCGEKMPAFDPKKVKYKMYCSKNCARLAANAKSRARKKEITAAKAARTAMEAMKEKKVAQEIPGLDACMKEAQRRGISYGQYMARRTANAL